MSLNYLVSHKIDSNETILLKDFLCTTLEKNYTTRLAYTKENIEQIQELYKKIFFFHLQQRRPEIRDKFSRHLITTDKNKKIVAALRLINNSFFSHNKKFRSEDFFNIQNLLTNHDNYLELSRFCIDEQHRNGLVLNLIVKKSCKIYFTL